MSRWWRRAQPPAELTTCGSCASASVIAADWTRRNEHDWRISVRCGECGASQEVIVSDAAVRRYDRGMHAIACALDRLDRDLVDADDFAR
jgi:hypothetical protein